MFDNVCNKLLEDYLKTATPLTQGPNVDFKGPTPAGFLGGGLPGINPGRNLSVKLKKKRKKINKKA